MAPFDGNYIDSHLLVNSGFIFTCLVSRFYCQLTNAKLYLNSECYPYNDLNLDFDKNRYTILYDLYILCTFLQGLLRLQVSRAEAYLYNFFT